MAIADKPMKEPQTVKSPSFEVADIIVAGSIATVAVGCNIVAYSECYDRLLLEPCEGAERCSFQ